MNKKIKQVELARALGVKGAFVAMAVKRGHLVREGKMIDLENPLNKLWLQNMKEKGKVFDYNRIFEKDLKTNKPEKKTKEKQAVENKSRIDSDTYNLALQEKKLKVKKLKNEDRLATLKIQKMEGELLPVDAAREIFVWCIETFYNTFNQETNNIGQIYASISGMKHEKIIELKKQINESLIQAKKEAKENMIKGLDGKVNEYKEVRGRGESR